MRIVSLLPSATEIVCELGLMEELVGVSHDCDWPDGVRDKPVLSESNVDEDMSSREIDDTVKDQLHTGSSVYHLDQERLQQLDPDVILTQELCEVCAPSYDQVQEAAKILHGETRIVSLEPDTLEGILDTIELVGDLTETQDRARDLVSSLRERIERVKTRASGRASRPRVASLEWLDPLYVGGHWVPEMISWAGGESMNDPGTHSQQITIEDVRRFDPECIVLMPCGFELERAVKEATLLEGSRLWNQLRAVEHGEVYAVNASHYFNRPGPRIVTGLEILARILCPDLFEDLVLPDESWCRLTASPTRSS